MRSPELRLVRELAAELFIRVLKLVLAAVIGLVIYAVLTGPMGAEGSPVVALLAWIAGALVVLLLETGPF